MFGRFCFRAKKSPSNPQPLGSLEQLNPTCFFLLLQGSTGLVVAVGDTLFGENLVVWMLVCEGKLKVSLVFGAVFF